MPYAADPAVTRHLARFLARQSRAAARAPAIRRGPSGLVVSDARAVQRRRDEGRCAARADRRRAERLAARRKGSTRSTSARARRPGSRSRGRARRGVLRHGAPRPRRADSQRRLAQLLRRHRERDAGGSGIARAAQGAVRRAVRDGGRHAAPRSPDREFGLSSASRRSSDSSARRSARPTRSARSSRTGATISRSSVRSKSRCRSKATTATTTVPVTLESRVTEIGTLELWCVERTSEKRTARSAAGSRWKLELNIREREDLTCRRVADF